MALFWTIVRTELADIAIAEIKKKGIRTDLATSKCFSSMLRKTSEFLNLLFSGNESWTRSSRILFTICFSAVRSRVSISSFSNVTNNANFSTFKFTISFYGIHFVSLSMIRKRLRLVTIADKHCTLGLMVSSCQPYSAAPSSEGDLKLSCCDPISWRLHWRVALRGHRN